MSGGECVPISEWPPPGIESDPQEVDGNVPEEPSSSEPLAKKPRLTCCHPRAEKLLAGWVRRNWDRLKRTHSFPEKCNPKTVLNIAGDTREGQELLEKSLQDLLQQSEKFEQDPEYHNILATYNEKLGNVRLALTNITKCIKLRKLDANILELEIPRYIEEMKLLDDVERDTLWLYAKLCLEVSMKSVKKKSTKGDVVVVDYDNVSHEMFKNNFCKTKTPVVFMNVPRPTKDIWTHEFILKKAGKCKFVSKVATPGSTEWAGLESSEECVVSEFLSSSCVKSSEYLFDWSLPLNCPVLNENFVTPSLLQENYLKRTSTSALYHDSWPSLFVAKKGTNSGLHIDAFGSHFWMYLVSGNKRWTFYAPEDAGSLNPKFYDSLDPIFRPSKDQLESLQCYSVELRPGQLLFVPSGSPHRVENITDTVAVSGNFVNDSNLDEVIKHLKVNALKDPRSEDLLAEFFNLKIVQ